MTRLIPLLLATTAAARRIQRERRIAIPENVKLVERDTATCEVNGELLCNGPWKFGLCNWGQVVWQDVALGTMCQNGQIGYADMDEASTSTLTITSTSVAFETTSVDASTVGNSTFSASATTTAAGASGTNAEVTVDGVATTSPEPEAETAGPQIATSEGVPAAPPKTVNEAPPSAPSPAPSSPTQSSSSSTDLPPPIIPTAPVVTPPDSSPKDPKPTPSSPAPSSSSSTELPPPIVPIAPTPNPPTPNPPDNSPKNGDPHSNDPTQPTSEPDRSSTTSSTTSTSSGLASASTAIPDFAGDSPDLAAQVLSYQAVFLDCLPSTFTLPFPTDCPAKTSSHPPPPPPQSPTQPPPPPPTSTQVHYSGSCNIHKNDASWLNVGFNVDLKGPGPAELKCDDMKSRLSSCLNSEFGNACDAHGWSISCDADGHVYAGKFITSEVCSSTSVAFCLREAASNNAIGAFDGLADCTHN